MNIGIGFIFTTVTALLGMWAIWQRRYAWGIWETPITANTVLLTVGALLAIPIFWLRDSVWWWGHAYVASAACTYLALANFAVVLKQRATGVSDPSWNRRLILTPTLVGVAAMIGFYLASGAAAHPWILEPDDNQPILARLFWLTIAITLTYQLTLIVCYLLRLRKDPRRTDRWSIDAYLLCCGSGMALAIIAVFAAHGYGENMGIMVIGSALCGVLTAGKASVAAVSWRRKTQDGTQFTHHQCKEFGSSFPQPAGRCACQHGDKSRR